MPDSMVLHFLLSDPVMHWGVFALFSGLLCYGFYRSAINPIPVLKIILVGVAYVLFIEIYQSILPWRSFGFDDTLLGSIGVVGTPFFSAHTKELGCEYFVENSVLDHLGLVRSNIVEELLQQGSVIVNVYFPGML